MQDVWYGRDHVYEYISDLTKLLRPMFNDFNNPDYIKLAAKLEEIAEEIENMAPYLMDYEKEYLSLRIKICSRGYFSSLDDFLINWKHFHQELLKK